jgi:hypothetical protein
MTIRRNPTSLVAGLLLAFGVASVFAGPSWQSLLRNEDPQTLFIGPLTYNRSLYGPYGAPPVTSYWQISQWNNPIPFMGGDAKVTPPSPLCNAGQGLSGVWSIENPAIRVCSSVATRSSNLWPAGATVTQLAQDGRQLKCGNEYDLFLSPIDSVYPGFPQNVERKSLADLQSLELNVSFQLVYSSTAQRCEKSPNSCGPSGNVDYSYITIGVPLSNPVTDETIFYQILVFDTRWSFCAGIDPCSAAEPSWYFTTLPQLGVNYNIANFAGQQCLRRSGDTARVTIRDELLQTLKDSIVYASTHFGADGNTSHWRVGSLYIGSGMQGSADVTTNIGHISFRALL